MHFSFPPLRTVTNATNAVWVASNDRVSIAAGRPFTDNSNWHIFTGGAVGPGCRIIDSANSNMFSPLFPIFANMYSAVKRNTNLTSHDECWRYGGAVALAGPPNAQPAPCTPPKSSQKFKIMKQQKAKRNLWSLIMRMWLARPESLGIGSCLANGIQLRRRPMLRVRLSLS